jgi:trimeric autotransporter adhesin
MKGKIRLMKNRNTITICTTILLACFGFLPGAQPVVPAPDGGYPGGNTAEGQNALLSLTTGTNNTAVGWSSLKTVATGQYNTAIGAGALSVNTANLNTATGAAALWHNSSGHSNTANGFAALFSNTIGAANTANGYQALLNNTTGIGNTANGVSALRNSSTGDSNTALGLGAGSAVTTADNVICIGTSGENVSNTCYIGNIFGVTSSGGATVAVNSAGKLGTATSSRRFKDDIRPMDQASEALFALKPVTFRYKKDIDPARTSQLGLVAEDVEKINPDLVVRDKEGKPYSVRYDQVNAMLLNEFLKEHRKIEQQDRKLREQEATIEELKKEMAGLATTVKEQAAQIRKVSAGVEMSKFATERTRRGEPAPKMVLNNP